MEFQSMTLKWSKANRKFWGWEPSCQTGLWEGGDAMGAGPGTTSWDALGPKALEAQRMLKWGQQKDPHLTMIGWRWSVCSGSVAERASLVPQIRSRSRKAGLWLEQTTVWAPMPVSGWWRESSPSVLRASLCPSPLLRVSPWLFWGWYLFILGDDLPAATADAATCPPVTIMCWRGRRFEAHALPGGPLPSGRRLDSPPVLDDSGVAGEPFQSKSTPAWPWGHRNLNHAHRPSVPSTPSPTSPVAVRLTSRLTQTSLTKKFSPLLVPREGRALHSTWEEPPGPWSRQVWLSHCIPGSIPIAFCEVLLNKDKARAFHLLSDLRP